MYYMEIRDPFSLINSSWPLPEGYDLVERPEHVKKRLEKEIGVIKREISYHSKHATSLSEELEKYEKELKKLGKEEK